MTIQPFTVIAAVAAMGLVSFASAAECKVTVVSGPQPKTAREIACPSLYLRGNSTIDLGKPETVTDETLKNISPCKEPTCLTELKNTRPENCTSYGVNVLVLHETTVALCEAFNAGPVSVADATAILQPAFDNVKAAVVASNGTLPPDVPTPKPNDTTTPTLPTPPPKSGASSAVSVAVAGAAVMWTAAAIQWLA